MLNAVLMQVKVIGSGHIRCKSGNVLEIVQDTDIVVL